MGALAPQDAALRVPWQGGVLEAREGQADLSWRPEGAEVSTSLAERPVHALAVTQDGLWVGTADGVRPWHGVPPQPGRGLKLGVAVIEVVELSARQLLAMTRDHGLVLLRVER